MAVQRSINVFEYELEAEKALINKRNSHLMERSDVNSKKKREMKHCQKVRYRDSREAKDALWSTRKQRQIAEREGRNSNRREARTYRCGKCRGWHLSSQVFAADWEGGQGYVA